MKCWLLQSYLTVGESFPGRPLVRGAVLLLPLLPPGQELEARVQAARVRLPPRLEGVKLDTFAVKSYRY